MNKSILKSLYLIFVVLFSVFFVFFVSEETSAQNFCDLLKLERETIKQDITIRSVNFQVGGWPKINDLDIANVTAGQSIEGIVAYFFYLFLWLTFVAAFLAILNIGFSYYKAQGSPRETDKLKKRFKNVLVGILIVVFSISILNFIDIDNQERVDEIYSVGKTVLEEFELPGDFGFLAKRRDVSDHDYFPIPFTNQAGASGDYEGINEEYDKEECNKCEASNIASNTDDIDKPACDFFCNENTLRAQKIKDVKSNIYVGYDTLKNNLECKVSSNDEVNNKIKSYAIVDGDDDTPVSCAGACIAIAYNKNKQHNKCSEYYDDDNNKETKKWIEEKSKKHFNAARVKGGGSIYNNFYMFGSNGSMNDGDLRDSTVSLRQCIADEYVYDAQEFPYSENSSFDVCLCRV